VFRPFNGNPQPSRSFDLVDTGKTTMFLRPTADTLANFGLRPPPDAITEPWIVFPSQYAPDYKQKFSDISQRPGEAAQGILQLLMTATVLVGANQCAALLQSFEFRALHRRGSTSMQGQQVILLDTGGQTATLYVTESQPTRVIRIDYQQDNDRLDLSYDGPRPLIEVPDIDARFVVNPEQLLASPRPNPGLPSRPDD
jgi:hypothetical protein